MNVGRASVALDGLGMQLSTLQLRVSGDILHLPPKLPTPFPAGTLKPHCHCCNFTQKCTNQNIVLFFENKV